MLDVHPPHEPVHGIRDFLLHILTITVGLLIALGLEAAVEWRHHVHLRHEAEENIRREIRDNQKDLHIMLDAIPAEQKNFAAIAAFLKDHAAGKPVEIHSVTLGVHLSTPQDASWQTATVTGVLAYMDYAEVQRFAGAYQLQRKLDSVQDTTLQPVITLIGSVGSTDPDSLSKEESLATIAQIHGVTAHLEAMRELATDLDKQYDVALKSE